MADTKAPSLRIVPGAPPPPPLSKSQKKKRKSAKPKSAEPQDSIPDPLSAALVENAPTEADVKEGSVAPELVAQPASEEPQTPSDDPTFKPSPIIELLNKRMKALYKKMIRIQAYLQEDSEKLNEDQKRLLGTLPALEAVHKELEEVKKVISTHEAEVAQESAAKRAEAAKAERDRLLDAVAAAESVHRRKAADLVTFARLHELRSSGHPAAVALDLSEYEGAAIFSANQALFGEEPERKGDIIHGFFTAQGEHLGVPYARLAEIAELFLNPPRAPTPEEPVDEQAEESEEEIPDVVVEENDVTVAGLPSALAASSSFHFMQEDELASGGGGPDFEDAEFIERADIPEEASAEVEIDDVVVETTVNGHTVVEESVTVTAEVPPSVIDNAPIDWADEEEGGLPPIAGLHERFGTSGEATPVVETPEPALQTNGRHVNGTVPPSRADDDGFTPMRGRGRGGRGGLRGERGERGAFRGRGGERGFRGGFRGGDRGGLRGKPNGEWRGGDGEHRGRGEWRGGDGEHRGRGDWRGGDGEHRGRGDWRGGDGEHRGRGGRGRGRGFHEARGGAPPTPA